MPKQKVTPPSNSPEEIVASQIDVASWESAAHELDGWLKASIDRLLELSRPDLAIRIEDVRKAVVLMSSKIMDAKLKSAIMGQVPSP